MHPHFILPVLLLPLAAQSPTRTLLVSPTVVGIHTAAPDVYGGGGTFAVGADYKVRFDGGMQFVPYLGAAYPHNQPFGWHTSAITAGGAVLPLRRGAGRAACPTRYEYDLGVAVESYEVRAGGLEQSFTFATRPGDGELRIRGACTTALSAPGGDRGHAAVSFLDEHGTPIVGYGAATAIDAGGHRFPMRTVVDGSTVELVLAAADVAAVRWPLVVDPLVSNLLLSTSGTLPLGQPDACDVARDDENNQLMVAIQRHASATDEDLFLRLFSDGFASSLGLVFADVDTTWDTTEPKVTFVGGADRWVAVFTRAFATNTKAVRWHPHVAGSTALDSTVGGVTPPAGYSDLHPAIGGYAGGTTGVHAVLCWQRDQNLGAGGSHTIDDQSRIFFARVDMTGAGAGTLGAATEVTGTDPAGAADRERPTINRLSQGNTTGHFLIAFQTYWNAAPGGIDDWDVEGRRIDGAGAFLPGIWTAAGNSPDNDHKLGPIVDGMADEYVIAYSLADNTALPFKTLAIEGSRVACESYNFNVPAIGLPQVLFDTGFVKSMTVTGLSYDTLTHSHAVVVYHDHFTNRLYAEKVGYQNRTVEEFTVHATAGQVPNGGGAAHDPDNERHVFVYGVEDGGVTQPVYGGAVTYVATPNPAQYGTPGCAQGGIIWVGYHRIGHQEGSVHLIAGPPSALALIALSLGPANAPLGPAGLGSCVLLVDPTSPLYLGSVVMLTSPAGYASLALPIPESMPPFTCYFQWLVFTGPLANTRNTTGLSVVFDR